MAKQPLLGSHQRSWIWGRNLVAETLRAGRWTPYELRLADDADEELRSLASSRGIPIHDESTGRLTQLCGATDHQSVLAKMPPFPYASSIDLFNRLRTSRRPPISPSPASSNPLFILTDHLQDAYNFGAIVRNAECFGADGVFIPRTRQVGVTSQVARSSAGAVNHVPIAQVDDLLVLVDDLKQQGVRLVAASEHAAMPLPDADLTGPLAIVIGNEGVGVSRELLAVCDLSVAIPLAGQVGSLNAAVAAGILIYEATRRTRANG